MDYLDYVPGIIGMINSPLYHYVKRSDCSLSISYHENDLEDTKKIYTRFVEWENMQKGSTADNILVVKSIFITDWVSRLTSMYDNKTFVERFKIRKKLDEELRNREFRKMLKEVYRAKKISALRYYTLRIGVFEFFVFFRWIYQIMKG